MRINPKTEAKLTAVGKFFYALREYTKVKYPRISKLITKTQFADLTDDLSDGLTSEENMPTFLKILNFLSLHIVEKFKVTFLTGDIHTGGSSDIFIKQDGKYHSIKQVVSSPIGYEPMDKKVKNNTTEENEIILFESDEYKVIARNNKYISRRNFALLKDKDKSIEVEHFFEGNELPYLTTISQNSLDIQVDREPTLVSQKEEENIELNSLN